MSPEATYDFLSTGAKLQEYFEDFSPSEVQLFCYLSCLLSLYEGNPVSFWEYEFIKNEIGSPYSEKIDSAFRNLLANRLLSETSEGFYKLNLDGFGAYELLSTFNQNIIREQYLSTACKSLSLIPFGQVRDAINSEPVLKYSRNLTDKRILNDSDNVVLEVLYSQFQNLKKALSDTNLLIPAVVWIKYLVDNSKIEESDC